MALIHRITRLFRADMHAVLDRIEEPDSLLRQSVRDMEEDITQHTQQNKLHKHELEQIARHQLDLKQSLAQLDSELDTCLDAQNDELARALLRRKLEAERLVKHLQRRYDNLQARFTESTQQLADKQRRCEAMRQKLELLVSEHSVQPADDTGLPIDVSVSEADVEVALLRAKQQRRSA